MGAFSIWHWLILLVVVVVVFGTAKLKNAGKDLGSAVKGFKDAVKDEEAKADAPKPLTPPTADKITAEEVTVDANKSDKV